MSLEVEMLLTRVVVLLGTPVETGPMVVLTVSILGVLELNDILRVDPDVPVTSETSPLRVALDSVTETTGVMVDETKLICSEMVEEGSVAWIRGCSDKD
jgi:hypothetical protein